MALKVASPSDASKYWVSGAQARSDRYATNTPAAAGTWQQNTVNASANYKSAVSAANIDKMFSGGVTKAGAAKFQRKVQLNGTSRFPTGVSNAQQDYEAGVAPFLDTIKSVDLPARKVRGDPANQARSTNIQVALFKKRLALRGA